MSQLKMRFPLEIKEEPESEDSFENEALAEEHDLIKKEGDDVLAQSLCGSEFDNAIAQAFTVSKFEATPFELSTQTFPVKTEFLQPQNEFIAEKRNIDAYDDSILIADNALLEEMVEPPLSFIKVKDSITSASIGSDKIDNFEEANTIKTRLVRKGTKKGEVDHECELDADIVENAKLICCLCSEPLEDFTILQYHFRHKHNCAGYAVCCNKSFRTRLEYYDHLKWHKDPSSFKCTQCSKVLRSSKSLDLHRLRTHSSEQDLHFPCTKCDRKFCKQYLLDQHLRISHKQKNDGNDFDDEANKAYNVNKSIIIEKRRGSEKQNKEEVKQECGRDADISENAKLNCCLCSEPLENFTILKDHFRSKHNCAGYAVCCNKSFNKRGEYFDHLKLHKDPQYFKCTQCIKVMASRRSLSAHTLLAHSIEKDLQFSCTICDRKFCKQYLLIKHVRESHKRKIDNNYNNDEANKSANVKKVIVIKKIRGSEKQNKEDAKQECETDTDVYETAKLTCYLCSEHLESFRILKYHFRRKHNCDGYAVCCNKYFRTRGEYYGHLKWHEDPAYFKCNQCIKVFASRNNLYKHGLWAHSTEKNLQFPCTQCDRKFGKQYLLDVHTRQSHKRRSGTNDIDDQANTADNVKKAIAFKKTRGLEKQNKDEADQECGTDADIVQNAELTCCLCSEPLENFRILKYHFRQKHNCAGYAVCCNKSFYLREVYYDHLKFHIDPEYFKCDPCNKVLTSSKSFDVHRLMKHKSEQDFQFPCTICKRKFGKQYMLDQHLRNSGKCQRQSGFKTNKARHKGVGFQKVFNCKNCSAKRNSRMKLLSHMRNYHPKKYFKCTMCLKEFNNSRVLDVHKSRHRGATLNGYIGMCKLISR